MPRLASACRIGCSSWPLADSFADAIGVGLVVGVITYASLIVGELVPKQIALRDPEAIAVKVAPAMVLMAKFSLPLVWLLDRSGKVLLWLLGQRGEAEGRVSEDEIKTLVVEAENAGVLEPGEKEMIAGVMRLGDLPVGAVMTPRHEVSQIDLADAPAEIFAALSRPTIRAPSSSTAIAIMRSASSRPRTCSTSICRAGRPTSAR